MSLCVWPSSQEIGYNVLMISDGTKRSSTCFLKYRSPMTWYRQVQRQIVWFQGWKSLFFMIIGTKHAIFWKTWCSFPKTLKILTPSEGSGFLKSGMFRMIAHCRPMISPWSPCDYMGKMKTVYLNFFQFSKIQKIRYK